MNKHIKDICKIGWGKDCCRYLTMSPNGWNCERNNPDIKNIIDKKVESGSFTAQGINCDGKTTIFLNRR
jgi:hypothetical protein